MCHLLLKRKIKNLFRKLQASKYSTYNFWNIWTNAKTISDYIGKLFSEFLCRYKKGFNKPYALVIIIERWKFWLDKQSLAGTLLMDL